MEDRRLTRCQRAIIAHCMAGNKIRRRGAYGTARAELIDLRFASSVSIDQLLRDGWLRPAAGFGEYELNE